MSRRTVVALTVAEAVVMAAVVGYHLGAKSLFVDEGFTTAMAHVGWHDFWHIVSTREANQGLYYLITRGVVHLGDTEAWLRMVPAIAAVAIVPAMVALGRLLFDDDRTGLLAGLLALLNGFLVHHGQFSRAYTLTVFFVTLSGVLFLLALRRPTIGRWIAWAVAGAVACYCHFFAGLVIGAQLLALLARPRGEVPWRRVLQAGAILAALVTPLVLFVLSVPGDQIDFIQSPTVHLFFHTLNSLAGHGGEVLLVPYGALGVFALLTLARRLRRPDGRADAWPWVFALSWFVLPILLALAISIVKPIFADSYLLVAAPGLYLLAAAAVVELVDAGNRRWAAVALVLLVALGGRSVIHAYSHGTDEDWRAATASVLHDARPTDGLMFGYSDERTPFEYYYRRLGSPANAPVPVSPPDPFGRLRPVSIKPPRFEADELASATSGLDRIWVVQRATDDRPNRYRLPSARFTAVETRRFRHVTVVLYVPRGQ